MRRISDISTAEDIALEEEREVLRDWRWERWRSMIRMAGYWLLAGIAFLVGLHLPSPWLLIGRLIALL